MSWQTRRVGAEYDALAPDGSEIRVLVQVDRGSLEHCRLPAGAVTRAVRHRSVDEVWLCLAGRGQLWRRAGPDEAIVDLEPGVAVSIPVGSDFQFRADAEATLELVITTMPPWPGDDEAVQVEGKWQASL